MKKIFIFLWGHKIISLIILAAIIAGGYFGYTMLIKKKKPFIPPRAPMAAKKPMRAPLRRPMPRPGMPRKPMPDLVYLEDLPYVKYFLS